MNIKKIVDIHLIWLFRESGFESERWGRRKGAEVGAKERGRKKRMRTRRKLLDSEGEE